MTTTDWILLATAVATFVTAIVLFLQVSKLTAQLKAQVFSDYTKRYQDIILHFPEDVNEKKFILSRERQDYAQTMRYIRAYFDLCYEEWYLHRHKKIDADTWTQWKSGMGSAFSKNAFKQAWDIVKQDTTYGDEFVRFVENLLAK